MNDMTSVSLEKKRVFDVDAVRAEFPLLAETIHGRPLVYLDNGATTQKPQAVLDELSHYYRHLNSNVHRGAHTLSDQATIAFEKARETVRDFIHAPRTEEVIWTRGTTESINLVANSFGRMVLNAGDEVIVSTLEHHSNIVPWQLICEQRGATLKVIPINDAGELDIVAYHALLSDKTRIVSVVHVSNALGTINPIDEIVAAAKKVGAYTVVDGAQAVGHFDVDVQAIGCDFYAFSSHKLFGPTGIGVLWGRYDLLAEMPPYQGGGEMIEKVTFEKTTFNKPPFRFEAGTPDISGALAIAAGIRYLQQFDRADIVAHEDDVLQYAQQRAREIEGLRLVGTAKAKTGVMSFLLDGAHPHDVGTLLDQQGVAVRTGHHCAQPLMDRLGVPGTVRASFALYNTRDDVDRLIAALEKVKTFL